MKKILKIVVMGLSMLPGLMFGKLVWTPDSGWCAEGALLEKVMCTEAEGSDAESIFERAEICCKNGDQKAALSGYEKIYKKYSDSSYAAAAMFQAGHIYLDRCQYNAAFKLFQDIIINYPTYCRFNDVIETQFQLASDLQCGARPYYWGVIPGFKDYDGSIKYFESIVSNAPFSKYAPMALLNISDLAVKHGTKDVAIDALDRLVSNYKHSELTPIAYIKLGEVYESLVPGSDYDQGSTLRAINYYQDFLHLYPRHELVCEVEEKLELAKDKYACSKLRIGDFYFKRRNNPCAGQIYYNEAIAIAPNSVSACKAQKRLRMICDGIRPRKTVADVILGRYESPSLKEYLDNAELEWRYNEKFDEGVIDEIHLERVREEYVESEKTGEGMHIFDVPLIEETVEDRMESENLQILDENCILDSVSPLEAQGVEGDGEMDVSVDKESSETLEAVKAEGVSANESLRVKEETEKSDVGEERT